MSDIHHMTDTISQGGTIKKTSAFGGYGKKDSIVVKIKQMRQIGIFLKHAMHSPACQMEE